MNRETRTRVTRLVSFFLLLAGLAALTIWAVPFFWELRDDAARQAFIKTIEEMGLWGALLLMLLQALQVIIAVIPAGVVQVIGGAVYGIWGGMLVAMGGVMLGSTIVFIMVKKFGNNLAGKMVSEKKLARFTFLKDQEKLDTIVFLLFLIPGSPKDVVTYFIPMTSMKLSRFLLISTVGRIPGVLSGVWIGVEMGEGMWLRSIAIFIVCAVAGLVGLIYKDRIIAQVRKKNDNP